MGFARAFGGIALWGALFLSSFCSAAVEGVLQDWHDAARNRTVPVKVYAPQSTSAPTPVVFFSHGLGGSREGGKLWGEHWASHGYLVIHLQHPGSDESILKGGRRKAVEAASAKNLQLRVEDAKFALDELERRKRSGEALFVNADLDRIGFSGHSFGAATTLAVSGQSHFGLPTSNFRGARAKPATDPRIKASIAFSPKANERAGDLDRQFGSVRLPMLMLTGTKDGDVIGDGTTPADRLKPFAHMPGPDKYLANFEGGDHMVFGGHVMRRAETATDRAIQSATKTLTVAFWDAYLKDDAQARAWLRDSAPGALGAIAQWQTK